MLTEEQIKNLKPGDPVVMRGEFKTVDADGDIWIEVSNCLRWFSSSCVSLPSEHGTSLSRRSSEGAETEVPTPKHDPTRLFRKGDMVQPRSGKTVLASEYGFVTFHELDGQYEVSDGEARGIVTLIVNGHACFVSAFALELVTPVEEMEPYEVQEFKETIQVRERNTSITLASFDKECHPNAKAAAEAERDRLNAEWRKEQK